MNLLECFGSHVWREQGQNTSSKRYASSSLQDSLDYKVHLVNKVNKEPAERLEDLDHPVLLDQEETLVNQESQVNKDQLDHQVAEVLEDHKEKEENLENKDQRVVQEIKEELDHRFD